MKGETDYARLDAMTDEDIARAVVADPDAAPVDADWSDAWISVPAARKHAMLMVDHNIVAWFGQHRDNYRKQMNAVLRAYMEAIELGVTGPDAPPSPPNPTKAGIPSHRQLSTSIREFADERH